MSAAPRWVNDGDLEWYELGPFRAIISTTTVDDSGIVAIRVRVLHEGSLEGDDTPIYEQVAAAGLARRLETLKQELERDLQARVAVPGSEADGTWDNEPTTRTRTESPDPPKGVSAGFYIQRPPRDGK